MTTETSTGLPAEAPVPSRPLRKDAARNRELLISAAREVFAQRGLDVSLDDIAHHAGLGVGTAYRHFTNKHELAGALIEQAIDGLVAAGQASLELEDPWLGLVRFFEDAMVLMAGDRGLREVLMGLHDAGQLDAFHDRISEIVDGLLLRARRAGVVRPDAEASDIGFVMTMLSAVAEVSGETSPQMWRRYLTMLLEGFKPTAAPLPVAAMSEADFRTAMNTHKLGLRQPKT